MFRRNSYLSKVTLAVMFVTMIAVLSGCDLIDKLQAWKQGNSTPLTENPNQGNQIPQEPLSTERKEVVLYFSDEKGEYLVQEVREIPKVEGIARATVQELIAGPSFEAGLVATVPAGTQLLDINIRPDGLCIVDFSGDLVVNHPGGAQNEELTVYSIVNTLTQFPTVKEVQILVEGKVVETIGGYMDISTTFTRNDSIITTSR